MKGKRNEGQKVREIERNKLGRKRENKIIVETKET